MEETYLAPVVPAPADTGGSRPKDLPVGVLKRIPISDVPGETLAALRRSAAEQPWVNGGHVFGAKPAVFIQLRDKDFAARIAKHADGVIVWNWNLQFGRIVSVTLLTSRNAKVQLNNAVCFLPFERSWFDHLILGGALQVVIGTGATFLGAFEASFTPDFAKAGLISNRDHPDETVLAHWGAAVFYLLQFRNEKGALLHLLTAADKVQKGWVRLASVYLMTLKRIWNAGTCQVQSSSVDELAHKNIGFVAAVLQSFQTREGSFEQAIERLYGMVMLASPERLDGWHPVSLLFAEISEFYSNRAPNADEADIIRQFYALVYLLSQECDCGKFLPWLDGTKSPWALKRIELDLGQVGQVAENFWGRQELLNTLNRGFILSGRDIPVLSLDLKPELLKLAPDVGLAEVDALVDRLLAEAAACRQWSIPWGATVELQAGIFRYARLYEINRDVMIMLLDENGQYALLSVEPGKRTWWNPYDQVDDPSWVAASAALRLLCASIVRDFLVVEDRTKCFGVRQASLPGAARRLGPQYIYLPRVRYRPNPDIERAENELSLKSRVPHLVAAHLRHSRDCSEAQKKLAHAYGFQIPPGYTFVRPHARGAGPEESEKQRIYRSRSAINAIYESIETAPGPMPEWFKFEKDVLKLMRRLGFKVEHVAGNKGDDRGVDVFAISENAKEAWAIQCKCWRADRPVGPDVVRELQGALAAYPDGTRGMVVTTSRFTSGALETAKSLQIMTVDGAEFVSLVDGDKGTV